MNKNNFKKPKNKISLFFTINLILILNYDTNFKYF